MAFKENLADAVRQELKSARFTARNNWANGGGGGRVFFVLKTAATNYTQFREDHPDYISGDGVVTVAAVYNTVDAAVGACTADQGDTIYVMPGHTEDVIANSIDLDVAGITVICIGTGGNIPYFSFITADTSEITVNAADVRWVGGYFFANILNCSTAFQVDAAKDFWLEDAVFEDSAENLNFLSIVTTTTTDNDADGMHVVNCYWASLDTAALAFVSILGNADRVLIQNNVVDMAATNDVGHFITLAAKNVIGFRVLDNVCVVVGATDAAVGIFGTGSGTASSGIIGRNLVSSLDTTAALLWTAGSKIAFLENYLTGAVDKSGTLFPAADNPA